MPGSPKATAVLLMSFAVSCVAVDTMIIRVVAVDIHPFEIAFFRNLFSVVAVLPWLLKVGWGGLKTTRLPLHLLRAGLKLVALICFFFAVARSPLALVTVIAFTSPLFVFLGSTLMFGERPGWGRLLALAVGFSGVLIVVRPGLAPIDGGMLLAIASAVGLGGVGLLMKFLSVRETPSAVVSLNILLTVPVALFLAVPVWVTPSPQIMGLMVAQGLLGGMSQLSVSRAMSMADASILSPIEFLRLPLVVILAWTIYREPTDLWTILGGMVIFASTFGLLRAERAPKIPQQPL